MTKVSRTADMPSYEDETYGDVEKKLLNHTFRL